jgi:hypothetical protein
MALSDLTTDQLQEVLQLIKEKEELQKKLMAIDRSLRELEASGDENAPRSALQRRKRRVALKEKILAALTAAGKKGLSVEELATTLKAKAGSVSVWFYTTGKKVEGVTKIAPSHYSYSGK